MNKGQKQLLDKCIDTHIGDNLPLFDGIYIIQQRKLHDSGYRMMFVIGHTEYDKQKCDCDYYLLGTFSDVVDFTPLFDKYLHGSYEMCDLHLDINRDGIIHIWTNSKKKLKCNHVYVSSCGFEII